MELFVIKVNGFQLAVLDLLQLSCLFSPRIKFSKSSGILVYLLNNYNEIYDACVYNLWRICRTPFLKNSSGGGVLRMLQVFSPGNRNIIIVKFQRFVSGKNHTLKNSTVQLYQTQLIQRYFSRIISNVLVANTFQ